MSGIVDTSVFCGHWPFRKLPSTTPQALKAHLQSFGVRQAWVGSAEAVLYPDPMEANELLLRDITGDEYFLPVAIINPTLATWRRDAMLCLERWRCRAIKVVPNYHGYPLADRIQPPVVDLLHLAQDANVPVCVQMRMMDERTHHPLMRVPGVPAKELVELASRYRESRLLACGAYLSELPTLARAPNVWAEVSLVEGGRSLWGAIDSLGANRVVFGSHSPFQYFEAMAAKLEADPIDVAPDMVEAVREHNAMALLGVS